MISPSGGPSNGTRTGRKNSWWAFITKAAGDCEIKLHLQTWTNSTGLAWHLGIYNDAWAYLPKFQPFLNALSEAQAALDSKNETWERNKCLTTEQIYDIFKACKVKDFTFLERG